MSEWSETFSQYRAMGGFLWLALIFIAFELLYAKLTDHDDHHDFRETAASVGVAIGDVAMRMLTSGLVAVPFMAAYNVRVLDIPTDRLWSWVLLFLGVEFCYYWFHVASHRVRWLWATHAVHHSAMRFNLSAAIRLGWTGQLTGAFVFFLPLAFLGFHPFAVAAVIGLGLLYQFFLHAALPVSLGPLERILNTPTHHRVHHASNGPCLDKNYGNVLIVFDRLFGTFAAPPAGEAMQFGIKGRAPTNNPVKIALGEWHHLMRDFGRARGLKSRFRVLFGPPG